MTAAELRSTIQHLSFRHGNFVLRNTGVKLLSLGVREAEGRLQVTTWKARTREQRVGASGQRMTGGRTMQACRQADRVKRIRVTGFVTGLTSTDNNLAWMTDGTPERKTGCSGAVHGDGTTGQS